ncbi:DeoR/GlpR family DNA-binding transcription regulator [Rhodovulum sp. DZ06]|uniref:DeoR/GlpR family DNA-binding transcription regulator n=1 Tax=Rhodovulum sp. DZ06 TaxID=3425126 RepID=UPI003D34E31C
MSATFRRPEILEIARRDGRVTVDGLAAHFGVALQTIRRDLADLAEEGRLERVHGGAILPTDPPPGAFLVPGLRAAPPQAAPRAPQRARLPLADAGVLDTLAAACVNALPEGASVFLGAGPAPEAAARALLRRRGLLAVTNSLHVAATLSENPDCEIVLLGGAVARSGSGATLGAMALEAVERFKLDAAVIGCAALDRDGDVLEMDMRLAVVHRAAMAQARRTLLICESARVLRSAPARVGSLRDMAALFTDRAPPPALASLCQGWDTRIDTAAARAASAA